MVVSIFVFFVRPSILPDLSIWHRLGIHSPSIGLTRAYRFVLHLHFTEAWRMNRLIFVVLAIGLPLLGKDVHTLLKEHKSE